ncbi:MAG: ABC transporter permease subunit [Pseudomonadales bacterium]|nr:ABC transporter permease subunit [Pseudomonadales bacterium]
MNRLPIIFKRELSSYFATPLAYVFIVIFLIVSSIFTFNIGGFYETGQADLQVFFNFHPWLYLFFVPAIAMRLWSEELRSGTVELLLTLPIKLSEAVLGKFLAAWVFIGIALLLTLPLWITVNYLGDPDNGIIFTSYLGSWLMSGAFLAIGSCMSATTQNQVIAFILTISLCFVFIVTGFPMMLAVVSSWLPSSMVDLIASMSFLIHFNAISRGVLDFRDLLFFLIMMTGWLFATAIVIEKKKAG